MNSMLDAQSDVAALAHVTPDEVYDGFHGEEDDAAEDGRNWADDAADDAHQYVDDVF